MNRDAARDLARRGSLYPSVILHGGDETLRGEVAVELARTLLCEAPAGERPCGACRHCRRIAWPADAGDGDADSAVFHADFHVLRRDLKTSTSVDATRGLLRTAQVSPFEARGQVFVVASAETLSGEAADALLKALEEPAAGAPRNYFLLAPSQFDLLPTLRSRSLAVYLGPPDRLSDQAVAPVAAEVVECLAAWERDGAAVHLLSAAAALLAAGAEGNGWDDPRAVQPWSLAAAAVVRVARGEAGPPGDAVLSRHLRRRALDLAAALLQAPALRLRNVPAERIVEGLVFRTLVPDAKQRNMNLLDAVS